jgi:hypothetical protein
MSSLRTTAVPSRTAPRERAAWRSLAILPVVWAWALTLEPALLGLLIAPSGPGVAIGLAALVAFVARTPSKIVLVDRRRHRHLPRTATAARIAGVEIAIIVVLAAIATATGVRSFWIPLLIAAPLVSVQLWFDMRSRSRRLVPELAGTIGIASVAAAIVLAGGGTVTVAVGAWMLMAARAVASLPFVRYQLSRKSSRPQPRWPAELAELVGTVLVVVGAVLGWISWPAVAVIVALVVVQMVLARVPSPRAAILGAVQLVVGLGLVVVAGLTMG